MAITQSEAAQKAFGF